MEEIRQVSLEHIDDLVRIIAAAYPGSDLMVPDVRQRYFERVKKSMENDQNATFHGCFRDGKLVGVMKWHDLPMNVHGTTMLTGGIGMVAVDLLHKKEKVAKVMLQRFLGSYRERGVTLLSLYPFRVDFYKQMGFGLGTKVHQYKIKPSGLPYSTKAGIVYLGKDDETEVAECYRRIAHRTHGMIDDVERLKGLLESPEHVFVGCRQNGQLKGFLAFQFQRAHDENRMHNHLFIKDFEYETREAFTELLSFLQSQADQIQRIVWTTTDEELHLLLSDPGNGTNRILPSVYQESHTTGVGLMYRIIDVPGFFRQMSHHRFGGQSCLVRFTIADSFLPENAGSWLIRFTDGLPQVIEEGQADAEVRMDISDFSSLAMGTASFQKLYMYGIAEIDNPEAVSIVDQLFRVIEKPRSATPF